ncbi:translation elongation factor [Pseudozyma hubeiensis SY62]|uniref:Translation elongation factor n=1 Tax=Pseudozyma hubeiensis (strain SY62) TaxID=1305764 RepID=R9P805_PSEHS|nr:translation elongation factor [Pseudozyma hubeiensis SY62]GAC97533.1 translation elongation factor [Pseudozyma hubeiensis SY62]
MQKIGRGCAKSLQPCSLTTSANQKADEQSFKSDDDTSSEGLVEDKSLILRTIRQKGKGRLALPSSLSCDSHLIFRLAASSFVTSDRAFDSTSSKRPAAFIRRLVRFNTEHLDPPRTWRRPESPRSSKHLESTNILTA